MKKIMLLSLTALILLVIGASTVGGSHLPINENSSTTELQVNEASTENQTAFTEDLEIKLERPPAQSHTAPPIATLTVASGDVFTCVECTDSAGCQWGDVEYVSAETGLEITEGSSIRTSQDGGATINFGEEVSLVLSSNTQIRVKKYQMLDENTSELHVELLVGETFFQVNYTNEDNLTIDFKLISPITLVENSNAETNKAFSGVATVSFPKLSRLSPAEMENQIVTTYTCFNNQCGVFCNGNDCSYCQQFSELSHIKFTITDNSGESLVYYLDELGLQSITLLPGQSFTVEYECTDCANLWQAFANIINALSNGDSPSQDDIDTVLKNITPPPPHVDSNDDCGDGICDIYHNENKTTCPADCN